MICPRCAWAADTYGDAEWIEGRPVSEGKQPDFFGRCVTGAMKSAAAEAHIECANSNQECDCQHWLPGRHARIVRQWLPIPTRCDACFQRFATTKAGVIWRHTMRAAAGEAGHGKICPGSGMVPLVRATVPSATSSSEPGESDSSSTPDTSPSGQGEQ